MFIFHVCNWQENGLLYVPKGQAQNAQAQMFSDPNMAMDMMKKNLSMIIPQVTIVACLMTLFFIDITRSSIIYIFINPFILC